MIAVVDYGVGNLGSIVNMLTRVGANAQICSRPDDLLSAQKIILPGVGAFSLGMENLRSRGFVPILQRKVLDERTPLLGICLGMQLMTTGSEEGGGAGLGWFRARTVRFKPPADAQEFRVPHMGWNHVILKRQNPLFDSVDDERRFYFVHSYHVVCDDAADVVGTTRYGYEFCSVIGREHITGVQFHPEKSHKFGMRLMTHFASAAAAAIQFPGP